MRAMAKRLTEEKRLERHPQAMNVQDPEDLCGWLGPKDAACYCSGLGHCYEILGQFDGAWSVYSDAARLDPANAHYRENVSRIRRRVDPTLNIGETTRSVTIKLDDIVPVPEGA